MYQATFVLRLVQVMQILPILSVLRWNTVERKVADTTSDANCLPVWKQDFGIQYESIFSPNFSAGVSRCSNMVSNLYLDQPIETEVKWFSHFLLRVKRVESRPEVLRELKSANQSSPYADIDEIVVDYGWPVR